MKTTVKNVLFALFMAVSISAIGQNNPFEEFGYTPGILTLSNGEFEEFFDSDTIVQIGSALYNTKSKHVIGFIEKDTIYSETTLEPEIVSRWLSPDPLARKYPSISPYVFVNNSPLMYIDPDGRDIKPLTSSDVDRVETAVNQFYGLFSYTTYPKSINVGNAQGDRASTNVFTTNTSVAFFEKKLAKSGLSDAKKAEARAVFNVLSSSDIIEIGVVTAETNSGTSNLSNKEVEYRGTQNPEAIELFNTPNKTTESIQSKLVEQTISGTIGNDGAYGFYPEPNQDGNFKGVLLISPAQGSTPLVGGVTTNEEAETQSIIKSIQKVESNIKLAPKTIVE